MISFGLEKYYHLTVADFQRSKIILDDLSVIFNRFVISKLLVDIKHFFAHKLLADVISVHVSKCFVNTKCLE